MFTYVAAVAVASAPCVCSGKVLHPVKSVLCDAALGLLSMNYTDWIENDINSFEIFSIFCGERFLFGMF